MSSLPIVSIIVPVYNQEEFIGRCIRSLLANNYPRSDYEIIIINDASEDNTLNVIEAFRDELVLFTNDTQLGLPASLNKGINNARGRFIIRVDSDDYVHSEYINILAMHLSYNDHIDAVCCDYQLVDENEVVIKQNKWLEEPIGCGIMFRIEHLIKLGLYDEKMLLHEDKDLLLRFIENYNIYSVPLPLYRYRRHENNITNRTEDMKFYLDEIKNKYKDNDLVDRLLKLK